MKHLEPVVKKSRTYNILFLRDDEKVVRFRLKPFWVKFLALVFVVFSGAAGAAGYAAHYYWKKYNHLQHERTELAEKLGENRRQLGRFAGVERIKESTLPRSTMAEVTSIASGAEANGKTEGDTNGLAAVASQNGSTGTQARTPDAAAGDAAPTAVSDSRDPAANGTPSDHSAQTAPQAAGEGPTSTADPPALPPEEHPALISEVQVRLAGSKNFKLAFDLSNRDPQLTLNGRVHVAVATKTGDRHEVTLANRDALRFIINRYKRVNTSFSLPDDLEAEDVNGLFLTVTADSLPPVTYRFPVPAPS